MYNKHHVVKENTKNKPLIKEKDMLLATYVEIVVPIMILILIVMVFGFIGNM